MPSTNVAKELAENAAKIKAASKRKAPKRKAPADKLAALEQNMKDNFAGFAEELKVLRSQQVDPKELAALSDLLAHQKRQIAGLKGTMKAARTESEEAAQVIEYLQELEEKIDTLNAGMEDLRAQLDAAHLRGRRSSFMDVSEEKGLQVGTLLCGAGTMLAYAGAVHGTNALTGKALEISGRGLTAAFTVGAVLYGAV